VSDWTQRVPKLGSKFREAALQFCEQIKGEYVSDRNQRIQKLGYKFREAGLQDYMQLRGRMCLIGSRAFRTWDQNLEKQLYKISGKLRGRLSV
jgi:hypothetical protein